MPRKPRMLVDEAVVRAWVERTCAEQGVPMRVTDFRIIARVVAILRLSQDEARRRATQAQDWGRRAERRARDITVSDHE